MDGMDAEIGMGMDITMQSNLATIADTEMRIIGASMSIIITIIIAVVNVKSVGMGIVSRNKKNKKNKKNNKSS